MLAHRKILDAARRQKTLLHQLVEITDDFHARGQFIVTPVKAGCVDAVAAKSARAYAIERRWRMQADKRIGVVPMAARLVMPVDDNDVCIGLGQQLVCEAHAGGTAADDQIVSRQHCYSPGAYSETPAASSSRAYDSWSRPFVEHRNRGERRRRVLLHAVGEAEHISGNNG